MHVQFLAMYGGTLLHVCLVLHLSLHIHVTTQNIFSHPIVEALLFYEYSFSLIAQILRNNILKNI